MENVRCEKCNMVYGSQLGGCPSCNSKRWTEQILPCRSLGPTPPMNEKGFWDKFQYDEIEIEHPD